MSLQKLLEQAQGDQGFVQLASQLGIDENKTAELTKMLDADGDGDGDGSSMDDILEKFMK